MKKEKTRSGSGFLLLGFITIIFWSTAFTLTQFGLRYFSSGSLGFWRYLMSSLLILVKREKLPALRDVPAFLVTGMFGFSIYMIAFNNGQMSLTAATAAIVMAMAPVITSAFARILYKESMHILAWVAMVIEFIGIIILALWDGVFSINIGVLWMLAAACCISIYNLMQRRFTKKYSPLQATTFCIWGGTVFLAFFLPTSLREAAVAPAHAFVPVFLLALLPSVLGYLIWTKALSLAPRTASVTNFMFVTPFFATLIGFTIASEIPDLGTIIGGTVILTGVLLFNIVNSRVQMKTPAANTGSAEEA